MAYKSYYADKPQTATAPKSTGGGYQSYYGAPVQAAPKPAPAKPVDPKKKKQEEYDAQAKLAAQTQAKAKAGNGSGVAEQKAQDAKQKEAQKPKTSLFSKIKKAVTDNPQLINPALVGPSLLKKAADSKKTKEAVKDMAVDIFHVGQKSANTALAGAEAVKGLNVAAAQAATGNVAKAKETIKTANKKTDERLDKGYGGQGGYTSSKQADSLRLKDYKEGFIKPVVKGSADIAPLVAPAGETLKGASLFTKIARGAADNGIIGAGASVGEQYVDTGKVNLKDVAKSGAEAAAFGAAIPVAGKGFSLLKRDAPAPNSLPKDLLDEANGRLAETQARQAESKPGTVITPQGELRRAEPVVPGENSSAPIVATQAHKQAVDDYISNAHIVNPAFQQNMENLSKDLGLKYKGGPVKSPERSLTKVMEDYGGDPTKLKDSVRATIEVPDHSTAGFKSVIDEIGKKYKILKVKDGYKDYKNGYVDMKVTVDAGNGHPAEIILVTPEMLRAKSKLGGHDLYKIARDTTKSEGERKAAAEQMHVLYNNAHDSANKRLASSSEIPASDVKSSKALASDISTEPSRTTPTSLDEPVKTTVSRSSPEGNGRTDSTTSSGVSKSVRDGVGDTESVIPSTISEKTTEVKQKRNDGEAPMQSAGDIARDRVPQKVTEKRSLTPSETAHMESIGGYTHSKDMENDYAEMLRDTEKGLSGGQVIKNADGSYRRTSEHSKFYREFYKEHGKAPTKADWLEEAKRQLGSGKDAFGAYDDYKALIEREAKGVPGIHVDAEIPVRPKTAADKPALGNKASRVYDRLKDEQPDALNEKVNYETIKLKEQAERAVTMIEKDPQQAYRIAMGAETSEDVTSTAVNIAMAEKALDEGNNALYAQLTKNRSLAQTRRGQEIVSEKGSVTNNSTSKYVKQLVAERLNKVGNKYLSSAGLSLKKGDAKLREQAVKAIDQEVKKVKRSISKTKQIDLNQAQDILDKITCK